MSMSRQSCRRNVNRIRLRRSYTMAEVAKVLDVHIRTVQRWHGEGMLPIEKNDRPMLFEGAFVRAFVKNRLAARKCRLRRGEFYCLRCGTGVSAAIESVAVELTDRRIGKNARAIRVRGTCPKCHAVVVRLESTRSIFDTPWWPKLRQADQRLIGSHGTCLNADFR